MTMEKKEEERITSDAADPRESLPSLIEACALPNLEKMTPEEKKAYLDDLFFGDVFGEG
jgi:hypothetical protein